MEKAKQEAETLRSLVERLRALVLYWQSKFSLVQDRLHKTMSAGLQDLQDEMRTHQGLGDVCRHADDEVPHPSFKSWPQRAEVEHLKRLGRAKGTKDAAKKESKLVRAFAEKLETLRGMPDAETLTSFLEEYRLSLATRPDKLGGNKKGSWEAGTWNKYGSVLVKFWKDYGPPGSAPILFTPKPVTASDKKGISQEMLLTFREKLHDEWRLRRQKADRDSQASVQLLLGLTSVLLILVTGCRPSDAVSIWYGGVVRTTLAMDMVELARRPYTFFVPSWCTKTGEPVNLPLPGHLEDVWQWLGQQGNPDYLPPEGYEKITGLREVQACNKAVRRAVTRWAEHVGVEGFYSRRARQGQVTADFAEYRAQQQVGYENPRYSNVVGHSRKENQQLPPVASSYLVEEQKSLPRPQLLKVWWRGILSTV